MRRSALILLGLMLTTVLVWAQAPSAQNTTLHLNSIVLNLSPGQFGALPREFIVALRPLPGNTRTSSQFFKIPASRFSLTPGNSRRCCDLRQFTKLKHTYTAGLQFRAPAPLPVASKSFPGILKANGDLDISWFPLANSIYQVVSGESQSHPRITKLFQIIQPDF